MTSFTHTFIFFSTTTSAPVTTFSPIKSSSSHGFSTSKGIFIIGLFLEIIIIMIILLLYYWFKYHKNKSQNKFIQFIRLYLLSLNMIQIHDFRFCKTQAILKKT